MLQIVSRKFFEGDQLYETLHRGNFYTNYRMPRGERLDIPVGVLLPSTMWQGAATFTYEITERIEAVGPNGRPGTLMSTSGTELINDVAAVVSFVLGVTCTPDVDLARRLLSSEYPTPSAPDIPRKHMRRMFDAQVFAKPGDAEALAAFMTDLIGLERRAFEAAIRAVRRYVTAMHRLADDVSLAYAMLVMSVESLAQSFDGHEATWPDYDQEKRRRIDTALGEASGATADKVRAAVLQNEHVAMSRRFRDFALAHLGPAFFREEAAEVSRPCGRTDLRESLRQAYMIRSGYVHTLCETPPELWAVPDYAETVEVDGGLRLTFQGLTRLAKHVIKQVVADGRKVEREAFDWRDALPGTIQVRLAAQCWVHSAEGYTPQSARHYLAGFLEQASDVLRGVEGAGLTHLHAVLEKIEALVPGLALREQRLPMLALYCLFHQCAPDQYRRPRWREFFKRYERDFDAPSIEGVAAHLVLGLQLPWAAVELDAVRREHVRQRRGKKGLHMGELLEAAFALTLAESKRCSGDEEGARDIVCQAVEDWPGYAPLIAFEANLGMGLLPFIEWKAVLLAKRPSEATVPNADAHEGDYLSAAPAKSEP